MCKQVRRLEVKSLHGSVREALLRALNGCEQIEVLVAAPKVQQGGDWSNPEPLLRRQDFPRLMVALPRLRDLDLDAWLYSFDAEAQGWDARSAFYLPSVAGPLQHAVFQSNTFSAHLTHLHLRFDIADADLFTLLSSSGPTLVSLDLYTEHALPTQLLVDALASSLATLRTLKWTTNPPLDVLQAGEGEPFVDRLLPRFVQLDTLVVSATDISHNLLGLLPTSLRHLEVQAFTLQCVGAVSIIAEHTTDPCRRSQSSLPLLPRHDPG